MRQNARLKDQYRHCLVDLQRQLNRRELLYHHHYNDPLLRLGSTISRRLSPLPYLQADLRHAQMRERRPRFRCPQDPTWVQLWHRSRNRAPSLSVLYAETSQDQTAMLPGFLGNNYPHQMLATSLISFAPLSRQPLTKREPSSHGYITTSITTLKASLLGTFSLRRP